MERIKLPDLTGKALISYLVENKESLISQKKAIIKQADAFSMGDIPGADDDDEGEVLLKANRPVSDLDSIDELNVLVIVNTTNLMDSHDDVHLPKLWNKSLRENKRLLHLREHRMGFDAIISDGKDLKAYVEDYTWKALGYKYEGVTQALVFDSKIKRSRNSFMFEQYGKGYVQNHSVGMQYVKLELAVNDEKYEEEYGVWKKYIDKIANRERAEQQGYFWAVHEAKVIEGSAVPIGSNFATPTLENNKNKNNEPPEGTHINEPSKEDTQELLNEFKKILKTHLS
jgi:hypothetical protein